PSRVPEGLWVKCTACSQILYNKDLAQNLNVCPKCGYHFRMGSIERLRTLFDGPWTEYDNGLVSTDPLKFSDTKPYATRLKAGVEATGLKDAVVVARDRKSTRLNSSHLGISYAVFCLKKKNPAILKTHP